MREKRLRVPINAKSDTMFRNGMFKYSSRERRCLIIADGFYEPKGPKGTKREQYLSPSPSGAFSRSAGYERITRPRMMRSMVLRFARLGQTTRLDRSMNACRSF